MGRTLEDYFECTDYILDKFLNLPKKVQQILLIPLLQSHFYPRVMDDYIKSPIEQIFITAFDYYCEDKKNIYLFEQEKIECNNKIYYADFIFKANDELAYKAFKDIIKNWDYKLVIECDGYEFHQKTKEQVQSDNEREYDLKLAGYDVLRFSGTQIYNNPFKCAEDTYNYIIKKIQEK